VGGRAPDGDGPQLPSPPGQPPPKLTTPKDLYATELFADVDYWGDTGTWYMIREN
jgi:hypothetical protein